MNYIKFCHYEAPISSLTKMEIENPYLVLAQLVEKRSVEAFQNELFVLQDLVFREDKWRNYDPGNLYATYKDITRLIDVCYLINKYSPAIGSLIPQRASSPVDAQLMNDLNSIFAGIRRKNTTAAAKDPMEVSGTFLNRFYKSHHLAFLKIDQFNFLQIGLDASYMANSKYEYFAIEECGLMFAFHDLTDLIAEGYLIHAKGKSSLPNLEGCTETAFAIDKSHPSHLCSESIAKPVDFLDGFFDYCLNSDFIYTGINAWHKMLYKTNVWKEGGNPGNLLYLSENIMKLIDTVWLLDKKGDLEKLIGKDFKADKKYKSIISRRKKKEAEHPLIVIRSFFAFKKMYEWKVQLQEWLECSLSNDHKYTESNRNETDRSFKHLLRFLEAAYLIYPVEGKR